MIEGVIVKKITTYDDERGFFREIFRFPTEFNNITVGQLSHSLVKEGVIKGWHGHKEQSQWNYVVNGMLNVVLYDNRSNSPSFGEILEIFLEGEKTPLAYYFPPGVLHAYKCLQGPMNIIYVTSGCYDMSDEIRISLDNNFIDYHW